MLKKGTAVTEINHAPSSIHAKNKNLAHYKRRY